MYIIDSKQRKGTILNSYEVKEVNVTKQIKEKGDVIIKVIGDKQPDTIIYELYINGKLFKTFKDEAVLLATEERMTTAMYNDRALLDICTN